MTTTWTPHNKQAAQFLSACGGNITKLQQLVAHIAKQQDVINSLYTNKDNADKITNNITTQIDNCFNKAPTKNERAKAKAFDSNANTNAKGKGKGKGAGSAPNPASKGKANGKGKPQALTGNNFVNARILDADMLTFEGDEGEPAHRIADGELLGRDTGYELCTQEDGMANLVSAYKVPVREGVNCAVIFAVDIDLSYNKTGAWATLYGTAPTAPTLPCRPHPLHGP